MKHSLKLAGALALTLVAIGSSHSVCAQEMDYYPFQVGLEGGTTGIGGSVGWRFSDHFGTHFGLDYYKDSGNENIEGINYDLDAKLLSEPLTLDWYPWVHRSFRVSLGVLFNQNRLNGNAYGNPADTVTVGGDTYGWGAIGPLHLKVKHEPVAPYLSIGGNLFYFDDAHRWALTGELGAFYTGKADASLSQSSGAVPIFGFEASRQREEREIEDDANKVKIWPVVKLGVSFSF